MLYAFFMQGEEARWETFKRAEREAQHRAGLRDDAGGGLRLQRLSLRRRNLARGAPWVEPVDSGSSRSS
jgi:hypothetical protein